MTIEEGLTYLTLARCGSINHYAKQAWETFSRIDRVREPIAVPARIRYEIINHQARTTLVLDDLEAFCSHLEQGIYGARLLQSDQRRQETLHLYQDARALWPDEARLRSVAELFLTEERSTI